MSNNKELQNKLKQSVKNQQAMTTTERERLYKELQGDVKQAKAPKQPIPKSIASPGLLSYIAVSKFCDHLPLYRLESILQRMGVEIARTIIETAKANNLEPYTYLRCLLTHLPNITTEEELEALLPYHIDVDKLII